MDEKIFDLAVLGGGSGGVAAANRARSYGADVALVENDRLGGTCVNRGCIPKKLGWLAARVAEDVHNARGYGFDLPAPHHDFAAFRVARDHYLRYLNGRYEETLRKNGVEIVRAHGRFAGAHIIMAGQRQLRARHILIATGSRPRPLEIPGGEHALTSDDFFRLDHRPQRVAMVGAGYIAAELGSVLAALGSRVDMYLGGRRPLAHFDPLIGDAFRDALERVGVNCCPPDAIALERDKRGFVLHTDDGARHTYDAVFSAIGRVPNTDGLDVDAGGIELDVTGAVRVDSFYTTSAEHIYAIGDVTGRAHALTPVAIAAGRRLADRVFGGGQHRPIDPELIPTVVFSHPPVGTIGLTEPEARARHGNAVHVYTSRFTPLSSALTPEKQPAAIKLITVGPEERILGLHVIGDGADELLQGFAVAVRMGATKSDFDETIAIHPTTAEEIVTLK